MPKLVRTLLFDCRPPLTSRQFFLSASGIVSLFNVLFFSICLILTARIVTPAVPCILAPMECAAAVLARLLTRLPSAGACLGHPEAFKRQGQRDAGAWQAVLRVHVAGAAVVTMPGWGTHGTVRAIDFQRLFVLGNGYFCLGVARVRGHAHRPRPLRRPLRHGVRGAGGAWRTHTFFFLEGGG